MAPARSRIAVAVVKAARSYGVLLMVGILSSVMSGCQPSLEDVQKAVSKGDTESLLRFLKHENKALHVPSLLGLLEKAPKATQETTLREIFKSAQEDALVDAALGASPTNPVIQETFWNTVAMETFDIDRASRHLMVASKSEADRWSQVVADHLPLMSERFEKEPAKGAAFAEAVLKTELSPECRVAVLLKATDLVERSFAGSQVDPATARAFVARTLALQNDLQKTEPKHPMAGCLTVQAIADQLKPLSQPSLAEALDSIVPDGTAATCSEAGKIIKTAAVARLRDVALGEEIGRKVEIEPAQYCCQFSGEEGICNGYSRTACAETQANWVQSKPAKYAFAEGDGPEQDADRLTAVANTLVLVRKLGSVSDFDLETRLRKQAYAERGSAPDQKKVADLEASLKTQMEERKDYLYLGGYIVADHGSGTYEFAYLHAVPSCAGFSCPTPPNVVVGKHALVTTTETSFTTKGRFSIWASRSGTTEVTTTSGFNETWNKFTEVSKETVKDLDKEIADGQKELAALRAATSKSGKGLEAERRLIGKAVGELFTKDESERPVASDKSQVARKKIPCEPSDEVDCDPSTGLSWQREASTAVFTLPKARQYCAGLGSGWRVPSRKELWTLVVDGVPAIDTKRFSKPRYSLWTSTKAPVDTGEDGWFWIVDFSQADGPSGPSWGGGQPWPVLCVR